MFKSDFGHCNVSRKVLGESFIGEVVQCDEMHLQSNTAWTDTKEKSYSRSDRASGRDWFQMETRMIMARHLCNAVIIFNNV